MYGLFHRAIREMVTLRLSLTDWQKIEQQLGLGAADFITARVYGDDQTIALCAACADALKLDLADFFEEFGFYWVGFAAAGPYGGIMKATGTSLSEFISNMDHMHGTIRAAMPNAQTPLFDLLESHDDSLLVRYRSPREGLEPLVKGLLAGLMDYFRQSGTVTQLDSPAGESLFHIRLVEAH